MTPPATPTPPPHPRPRGLRLRDLFGLVAGYGMAALLARSFWPSRRPLASVPGVALVLEFLWLGLAMSGPIVLLVDRRGPAAGGPRPPRPPRPGRLFSATEPVLPASARPPAEAPGEGPGRYTRAELAWLLIGGYWIALTLFVVPVRSVDTPWALACLLQFVAALALLFVVEKRPRAGDEPLAWTHHAAVGLLYSWPIAWIILIVLSGSF